MFVNFCMNLNCIIQTLICCQSYQLCNTTLNQVPSNKERLNLPSTIVCGVDVQLLLQTLQLLTWRWMDIMLGQLLATKNLAAGYRDCWIQFCSLANWFHRNLHVHLYSSCNSAHFVGCISFFSWYHGAQTWLTLGFWGWGKRNLYAINPSIFLLIGSLWEHHFEVIFLIYFLPL